MEAKNQESLIHQISKDQQKFIKYQALLSSENSKEQIQKIFKEDYLPVQDVKKFKIIISKNILTELKSLVCPPPKLLDVLQLFMAIIHNRNPYQNVQFIQLKKELANIQQVLDYVSQIETYKKEVSPQVLEACEKFIKEKDIYWDLLEKVSFSGEIFNKWNIITLKCLKVSHFPQGISSEEDFQKAIFQEHNKLLEFLKQQQQQEQNNQQQEIKKIFQQDYSNINPL